MGLPYPVMTLDKIRAIPEAPLRLLSYSILLEYTLDLLFPLPKDQRGVRDNAASLLGYHRAKLQSFRDVAIALTVRNRVAHPDRGPALTPS